MNQNRPNVRLEARWLATNARPETELGRVEYVRGVGGKRQRNAAEGDLVADAQVGGPVDGVVALEGHRRELVAGYGKLQSDAHAGQMLRNFQLERSGIVGARVDVASAGLEAIEQAIAQVGLQLIHLPCAFVVKQIDARGSR